MFCFDWSLTIGERDAFYWLGLHLRNDKEKQKRVFKKASVLGNLAAMVELGSLFGQGEVERWYWWGEAAKKVKEMSFSLHLNHV